MASEPGQLSVIETAKIKTEIRKLEKGLSNCADGGIRKLIEAWIEEQKRKLEDKSDSTHRPRK
jgi:hypothetical protein